MQGTGKGRAWWPRWIPCLDKSEFCKLVWSAWFEEELRVRMSSDSDFSIIAVLWIHVRCIALNLK